MSKNFKGSFVVYVNSEKELLVSIKESNLNTDYTLAFNKSDIKEVSRSVFSVVINIYTSRRLYSSLIDVEFDFMDMIKAYRYGHIS